jgi:exosortase E/protease (VPEID-CTERM system)
MKRLRLLVRSACTLHRGMVRCFPVFPSAASPAPTAPYWAPMSFRIAKACRIAIPNVASESAESARSAEARSHGQPEKHAHLPYRRWTGLAVLLVAQILLLTLRFDAATIAGDGASLTALVEHARIASQLAVVALTATLIFGGAELKAAFAQLAPLLRQHCWWPWAVAQIGLYAVFVLVTKFVFESPSSVGFIARLGTMLWVLLALGIAACWGGAMLPGAAWLAIFRQHRWPLSVGMIVGAGAWCAGRLSDSLWLPLGRSTLWLVFGLLRIVGLDVAMTPAIFAIGTGTFSVQIAPQCSGYEGIGLALVFTGAFLWWSRSELRWPQAWLLLPLAALSIWLLNGVRIASLILIGHSGWQDVALGGFHSQAGWIAFNAVAVGVLVAARRSQWFCQGDVMEESQEENPTEAYLVPLLALVGTVMITSAFTSGFDWLYPLRVVAVGAAVAYYTPHYARFEWRWSWSAAGFGIVAFVMWVVLEPTSGVGAVSSPIAAGLASLPAGWAMAWLVCRVAGSVLAAPLAEELAFRGYLIRRMRSVDFLAVPPTEFSWLPLLASSALFGALHPGRWVAGTLAGILYGLAFYRRGSVVDAVIAHSVTNGLIAVTVLGTGQWSLWS